MARYSFFTTEGPDKGKTFELEPGVTFIGRRDTPGSDEPAGSLRWILTDPAVSRTHARIDWDGRQAPILIHLSSTNATLLDGRIVTGQTVADGPSLTSGNRLRMGQTTFEMQQVEDGEASSEAEMDADAEAEAESDANAEAESEAQAEAPVLAEATILAEAQERVVPEEGSEQSLEEPSLEKEDLDEEGEVALEAPEAESSEAAREPSRWYLQQRGQDSAEFDLQDQTEVQVDGLSFHCAETQVKVALAQEETEAYLLRLVDGQYWTTSLKPACSITLKNRDIVRTEQRKFELLARF